MRVPIVPTGSRPTSGVAGEIRFNVDTNEFQSFDGKQWRVVSESPTVAAWKKWRAWYPVKVNDKWTWGKTVYRKHVSSPGGGFWKYGTIFDVLKDV